MKINLFTIVNNKNELYQLVVKHDVYKVIL